MEVDENGNGTLPLGVLNNSLLDFLLENAPEYIPVVPSLWLKQEMPSHNIQTYAAIMFLIICIPAHIGHLLIFVAYGRYSILA